MQPAIRDNKKRGRPEKPAGIAEKVIRLLDILNKIDQGAYPSPASLAQEYGITRRSVHRYLEIINFIVPIEYDGEKKGYRFSGRNTLKKLQLSEGEKLLLLLIGDSVTHMGGPLKESYQGLISKLSANAGISPTGSSSPFIVDVANSNDSEILQKNLSIVARAVLDKNSIDIRYEAVHSREITERRVNPYGLIFSEGNWLMVGFCHLDQDIRKFDLDRILEIKASWTKFKSEDFNLQKYVDERWGLYDGEKTVVKVRFTKNVAHLITRKKKWHPSEKREILPTGEVELTFTVAGTEKLKKWIYTWIPNVEALEPRWLSEEMEKDLMEARHSFKLLTDKS
jgi:predicted DNA-binding transcriptional regulator YafY